MAEQPPQCEFPWRNDDFYVFYNPYTAPCSLNQTAHYALCCVWTALFALGLVESAVSQLRGTDRSPIRTRVLHLVYCVWLGAMNGYIVVFPYATVLNRTNAAWLLTLFAGRCLVSSALTVDIHRQQLLKGTLAVSRGTNIMQNLPEMWNHQKDKSGTGAVVKSLPMVWREKQKATADAFRLWHLQSRDIFLPTTVAFFMLHLLFLSILPNALYPHEPLWVLEAIEKAAWISVTIMMFVQSAGLVYFTLRVSHAVEETVKGLSSVTTPAMALLDSVSYKRSSTAEMQLTLLFRDMTKNTRSIVVVTVIAAMIYIVAAVVGFQVWMFHISSFSGALTMITYLTYYRHSTFVSLQIKPPPEAFNKLASLPSDEDMRKSTSKASVETKASKLSYLLDELTNTPSSTIIEAEALHTTV